MNNDVKPAETKHNTPWLYAKLKNINSDEECEVFVSDFYNKSDLIKWKNKVWKVISLKEKSPIPFLDW